MPSTSSLAQTIAEIPQPPNSDDKDLKVDHFPEGGTAAWCTVVGAALVQLCCFGYTTSFGVYQEFYTLNYLATESSSTVSWIGSVNAFMVTSFSVVAGILYDRGYFYYLMIGGSLLESLSLFMLSLAQPGQYYQIFLAQAIGLGISQGLLYLPTLAVVSHYFHQRRTLAMSLVACGSSIGSMVNPIMLNYLFRNVGFGNGVRISATFVSALLFIACLLMRTRLEPRKHHTNYLSVGKSIIQDVPFCIMVLGLLLFQIGFYFPLFYLQLDSVMHGNSETFSFYSLVLLNGGSLLGRLSAGFIASYVGIPELVVMATAACGILILGMIGLSSIPTVVVLGTLFGYVSGVYVALFSPLIALLTNDLSELGARMGIGITILGVGVLLGGPVGGALLTSQYKWWQSSLSGGLCALSGSALLLLMHLMRRRRLLIEKQVP